MTVKEYLEKNNPKEFVLTDRIKVPIDKDNIKYLELENIEVKNTEIKNNTLYIYTDYVADSC